jgi:hypothetical protein
MATNGKDTIYIDIDDEITTIIDKVRGSEEKIVALVLPKRASVLQSIVNMKLLKRAADNEKKSLVLITAETGLMPLATTVGLYVAKTLQTKPEIPGLPGSAHDDDEEELVDETADDNVPEEVTAATAGSRSVGELAGPASLAIPVAADEAIETLQLDDEEDEPASVDDEKAAEEEKKAKKPKKDKKNKKLAVPNFNRFRLLFIIGGILLVVLLVGGIVAAKVLPKATVTLTTDTSNIPVNLSLTADTTANTVNTSTLTLPATIQKTQKSVSQQVPTTGTINNGQKATGSVTLSLTDCSVSQVTVPAGTGVTANGYTFITQADETLQSVKVGSQCKNSSFPSFSSATANVTALAGGTGYNIAASSFSVAGFSDVSASSSAAMSGGTDDSVQIVAQADIDNATQKITAESTDSIKQQLEQQIQAAGEYALTSTFNAASPTTTTSANVGDQASSVTVTENTTYTMFGVKENDLNSIVDNNLQSKIDPSKQVILNEGLSSASFQVNNQTASTVQFALSTTATAGPDLQASAVKKSIVGLKSGEVVTMLKADPGVTAVNVHLSPFWVTSVPSNLNKVTVTFQKAQ